jgi:hypothetical protein
MSKQVCASDYGGPGDPTSGITGYRGDNLNGKMAFAELMMGTALGNLPYRAKVQISYNGRSVIAEKLDIGLGGAGCGGHSRAIDLWYQTAQALGFNGLGVVTVTLPGEAAQGGTTRDVGLFENPAEWLTNPGGALGKELGGEILGQGGGGGPLSSLGGIGNIPKIVEKIYELLFTPQGWIRLGKLLIGTFLLLSGVMGMANVSAAPIVEVGTKAAEVAAIAA